jgi:hypothetical protein
LRALAVFHDGAGGRKHWAAWLLRPGFKHVFVALAQGDYWITVDARQGVPSVDVVAASTYDLAKFYRQQGYTVLETEQRQKPLLSPFAVTNCVGLCKAMLCLRSLAITPYGLYRHFLKESR